MVGARRIRPILFVVIACGRLGAMVPVWLP
jgi:hypothetical protein